LSDRLVEVAGDSAKYFDESLATLLGSSGAVESPRSSVPGEFLASIRSEASTLYDDKGLKYAVTLVDDLKTFAKNPDRERAARVYEFFTEVAEKADLAMRSGTSLFSAGRQARI
jgi:hypothetical protein